jgi:NADPH:quinone reductase-like Zn-dependent oxidoreductase
MEIERRSYVVPKAGSLKNLVLVTEKLPFPQDHEVTVKVQSIGLNYADIFAIMGLYSATPKGSFIPGLEYAGEVIRAGNLVENFKVGDKVMGVTRFGGYTSHINIDARYIVSLPKGWSFDQGAAYPVQVLTAYYALVTLGNLQSGDTVLIHSAAGGVGLLANRIAKKMGAFTIGVVGDSSKLKILKEEGYDDGFVRSSNFREDLKKSLKGRELNLVLETTGGKYFKWSYKALAKQGRLIAYGSAQFTPSGFSPNYISLVWKYLFRPRVDPLSMIIDNKSLMAFNLIWLYEKAGMMEKLMKEIEALNIEPPHIRHTYDFDKLPEALRFFQKGKTIGKVIVQVNI